MNDLNEQDNKVQTLIKLGLTRRQAMVYLCLVRTGVSPIKTIAKGTNIARQHIYKVILALNELGLVEKALTAPIKFKATPIEIGISMLMEQKNTEYSKLQTETTKMLNSFKKYEQKPIADEETPQFVLVPGKKPLKSKLLETIKNSQKTIDVITPWQVCQSTCYKWADIFKECINKGVQFRHIIDVPPEKEVFQKNLKKLTQAPLFKIRYALDTPPIIVSVYDKKSVVLSSTLVAPMETPDLWVTNPNFVEFIQNYFDMMWTQSNTPDEL